MFFGSIIMRLKLDAFRRQAQGNKMTREATSTNNQPGSRARLYLALGAICLFVLILLVGKFGGFFDPVELGSALGDWIQSFADSPFGLPALILVFCVCAFIAVPQFVLIGIAVFAFGPVHGALYSWVATLCSGSLTFFLGRWTGQDVLSRFSGARVQRFTQFVGRNAFAASAIVRNVPAGPFLFVNMVFGATGSKFLHYFAGMAVGIVPKIAFVTLTYVFGEAALGGRFYQAAVVATLAALVFLAGWIYRRKKQRSGTIVSLSEVSAVDSDDVSR